jgi:hypothetical protein
MQHSQPSTTCSTSLDSVQGLYFPMARTYKPLCMMNGFYCDHVWVQYTASYMLQTQSITASAVRMHRQVHLTMSAR